jgi:hypothetical protein
MSNEKVATKPFIHLTEENVTKLLEPIVELNKEKWPDSEIEIRDFNILLAKNNLLMKANLPNESCFQEIWQAMRQLLLSDPASLIPAESAAIYYFAAENLIVSRDERIITQVNFCDIRQFGGDSAKIWNQCGDDLKDQLWQCHEDVMDALLDLRKGNVAKKRPRVLMEPSGPGHWERRAPDDLVKLLTKVKSEEQQRSASPTSSTSSSSASTSVNSNHDASSSSLPPRPSSSSSSSSKEENDTNSKKK